MTFQPELILVNVPKGLAGVSYAMISNQPGFCIGDDGSVWTLWEPMSRGIPWSKRCIVFPWKELELTWCGEYLNASLRHRRARVNVLVLEAFVGPRPEGDDACHDNGIADDNRLDNLYWGSRSQNNLDKRRHGTDHNGENAPRASVNRFEAEEIKKKREAGQTYGSIGDEYGIGWQTVRRICLGLTYVNHGESTDGL